ncbi:MAG: HEAT repeat domain-containing protein [Gemmataceae bacterium]|nr:HEAT repeat domain-containing protein [Gemmataceae bacterium]MDW8266001.1 HEAT repeat domain-containing protein [Gemmataceae bacterium]
MGRIVSFALLLTAGLGPLAITRAGSVEEEQAAWDVQLLAAQGIRVDGPRLLQLIQERTLDGPARERIRRLIGQLGDDSFAVRERASAALVAYGSTALPFLQEAAEASDPEVARRARACLERIAQGGPPGTVMAAVVRQVARLRPAGSAEALLAYLPSAESETLADEVRAALARLAAADQASAASLRRALADAHPVRRAAAAEALGQAAAADHLPLLRPLLRDPDAQVRWRTATVLAAAGQREAVPVLIDLLTQLPRSQAVLVDDLLRRLAGERAPAVSLGATPDSHGRCRDAWAAWWRDHGAAADFTRLAQLPTYRGYTLVVLLDQGILRELGPDNQARWQMVGLEFPLDVQILPGERFLVAEHHANRVTERNRRGDILWERQVNEPLVAQRLPNGNTFIATPLELLELDAKGKVVFQYNQPDGERIMKAQKLADGTVVLATSGRKVYHLDATGRERASFEVEVRTSGGRFDVTPEGTILVPLLTANKVREYDLTGKMVAELTVEQPVAAVRLPNGHTLVTSLSQRRAIELDRQGREVWQYETSEGRVTRAWRR